MPFIPLFAGLGTGVGEWFLFALVVYAAVAMMRRGGRRRRRWYGYQPEPVPRMVPRPPPGPDAGQDPQGVRRILPHVSAMTSGRLPVSYQAKVDEILRRIDRLLQQAGRLGSEDLYVVRQTAMDYLPTTLNAYLALPAGYAYEPMGRERKPALHVLWDQLCMLEAKLQEIEQGIHRRHADGLLANGRFLQERLSPPAAELGLHPETRARARAEEQEVRVDRPS
jgi:hypothetical protein